MGHSFFQTPPPQDTHVVRAPRPSGHVSALINPHPTMDQLRLDPPDKLSPVPLRHVNKTPSPPTEQKRACGPPTPEDNFWNSP